MLVYALSKASRWQMKHIYLAAILVFALPALAVSQRSEPTCSELTPQASDSAERVILNICNYGTGMVALPRARLHFRLYQSGLVEYEVRPRYDAQAGAANQRLLLKKARVSAEDVAEIIRLGEQADFQAAKSEYPVFRIWTDSGLKTTIVFTHKGREKKIVVKNYRADDSQNSSRYPASLIRMLAKADELRPKDN